MIGFDVLGAVRLRDDRGRAIDEVLAQPKRLALLAYIAAATPPGPHRRDALLAMFWPEYDDARARAALNRSVYFLRQHLGDDALLRRGGEELALAPERVHCDAAAFEAAAREGRHEEALALYRGDLLDGFHVSGAPEFEHWLDGRRLELRRQAEAAAWALADRARAAGQGERAVAWARRAYQHAGSLEETALRRLVACLAECGDHAGALRAYEAFARELDAELDAEPAPETRALAESIRARSGMAVEPGTGHPAPAFRWRRRERVAAAAGVLVLLTAAWFALPAPGDAGGPTFASAARTTASAEALRAFREGEAAYRSGQFTLASGAFERAIQADSGYTLAYLRLSNAANWTGESQLAEWAATQAVRLRDRLPEADRLYVEAWDQYLRGHAVAAEASYRTLLDRDRTNVEAWVRLGDLGYHWGPLFGSPSAASRRAWDRALALDPGNVAALMHRARIAAAERDERRFEQLAGRLAASHVGAEYDAELRLVRAFAFGDSAARRIAAEPLRRFSEPLRKELLRSAAAASFDLSGIDEYLAPVHFAGQSFSSREAGEMAVLAGFALARGRIARANAVLDSAAQIEPARILEYRAAVQAAPLLGTAAAARTLAAQLAQPDDGPGTAYPLTRGWRLYLQGLLALRLEDARAAGAFEAELAALGRGADEAGHAAPFAARFAALLAAERLRAAGRREEALARLGEPTLDPDYRLPRIWSHHRAHERFLRGVLLAELGRSGEAQQWFATFPDPNGYDAFYLPAAELWQMLLAERMGQRTRAESHRERVAALLAGADASLRGTPDELAAKLGVAATRASREARPAFER